MITPRHLGVPVGERTFVLEWFSPPTLEEGTAYWRVLRAGGRILCSVSPEGRDLNTGAVCSLNSGRRGRQRKRTVSVLERSIPSTLEEGASVLERSVPPTLEEGTMHRTGARDLSNGAVCPLNPGWVPWFHQ